MTGAIKGYPWNDGRTTTGEASPYIEPAVGAVRWAKVIDHTRCIGCHACSTACKSENQVPLSDLHAVEQA